MMFNRTNLMMILLAHLLLCGAMTVAVMADSIALRDEVNVKTGTVVLRDIAKLNGERARRLGDVVVGEMPKGQTTLNIGLAQIEKALNKENIHWGFVTIRGSKKVVVHRHVAVDLTQSKMIETTGKPRANSLKAIKGQGQSIHPAGQMKERLLDWISGLLGEEVKNIKLTQHEPDDGAWQLDDFGGRFEFTTSNKSMLGRMTVVVRQYRGDRMTGQWRLPISVAVKRRAVVAKRDMRRGQTVTSSDVQLLDLWIDSSRDQVVDSLDQVVGLSMVRLVRAGSTVDVTDLKAVRLVKRGQLVTVRCLSGGLVIKTVARAAEDGSLNQLIEVRSDRTRQTYMVRVSGSQEAVMRIGSSVMTAQKGGR